MLSLFLLIFKNQLKFSISTVFQTPRIENDTEITKWPEKQQDLDDFPVLTPEVNLLLTDVLSLFP
jgi:hypothetical protein